MGPNESHKSAASLIAHPLDWIYSVVCLENERHEISTLRLINAVTRSLQQSVNATLTYGLFSRSN